MKTDKCVGLDVHKDTTVVAAADAGRAGEGRIRSTGLALRPGKRPGLADDGENAGHRLLGIR